MEIKGKFVNVFDTVCDGEQTSMDDNGAPVLYDSFEEATRELFDDALAGLQDTDDDYFEESGLNKESVIAEMTEILESGNTDVMLEFLKDNPSANYHEEFTKKAEEFVLGRKAIFTGQGIVIEGISLENL